jgi:hypothetical protein
MTRNFLGMTLSGLLLSCAPAAAHSSWNAPGSLVDVSVAVDGATAPLYPAPDGSGRHYLEARLGAAYEVRLDNRSRERIGVVLSVDGLNSVSGERDSSLARPSDPGRMYVLEPWEGTTVRGWRTSLSEVHRFTFVDERSSYAARAGKANPRMGWIEVAVYREQRPYVWRHPVPVTPGRDEPRAMPAPPASAAPGTAGEAPRDRAQAFEEQDALKSRRREDYGRSYAGTGWGRSEWDQAVVVDFHPQSVPAERVTLRYEYAPALARLGVLPRPWPHDYDRLHERERGFAKPPRD